MADLEHVDARRLELVGTSAETPDEADHSPVLENDELVSGRKAIIQCLDNLLAKSHNIQHFANSFQAQIDNDAMGFFKHIVMPLLGREHTLTGEGEQETSLQINLVPAKDQDDDSDTTN